MDNKFKCRTCGCATYTQKGDLFSCDDCSVVFTDPESFSLWNTVAERDVVGETSADDALMEARRLRDQLGVLEMRIEQLERKEAP